MTCHSEKQDAAPTYKGGFGYHPLLCFLDNTGEALAGRLRPGNARANTASDHIQVLDDALAQIPDAHRYGTELLVRTDSADSANAFLTHLRSLRASGIRSFFSVGHAVTEPVRRAIRAVPDQLWHPALDQDGSLRDGAEVTELTGMLDLPGYPADTRIIVRRERPHPGAQLSLFDTVEGLRHQVFVTDTPYESGGSAQFLQVRHRGHPTVEDHIRTGNDTCFGRFPSRHFQINAAWLELSLAAIDLLAWTRVLLLDDELANAEPKKLRYRLLHFAACLTRGADASACGYRRPGPGEGNSPKHFGVSPPCLDQLADPRVPAHPRTESPGRPRPPRRPFSMPRSRNQPRRQQVDDQRRHPAPTERARLVT